MLCIITTSVRSYLYFYSYYGSTVATAVKWIHPSRPLFFHSGLKTDLFHVSSQRLLLFHRPNYAVWLRKKNWKRIDQKLSGVSSRSLKIKLLSEIQTSTITFISCLKCFHYISHLFKNPPYNPHYKPMGINHSPHNQSYAYTYGNPISTAALNND